MMKKVIDTNKEQQEGPSTSIEPDTNELEVEDKKKSPTLAEEAIEYPALENLTSDEIDLTSNCYKILEVFKYVTEEISSEKAVTTSKIILLIDALTNWCNEWLRKKDLPHQVTSLTKTLLGLEKRFGEVGDDLLLAEATFLDPRFKKYGFSNPEAFERCKERIISKIGDSRQQDVLPSPQHRMQ
ncbi:hypothetical protein J437_LFUL003196 [Ladona fulva]|uniref:Uncharacterized protein n=1 Tax=Ladona fulva TaxID=123851 RepID=A0A8K0K1X6_LADFU|nr:hypothetical protein J437_LFUL003196 [Ladona fulva]